MRTGWICPKCNRCLSPDVTECSACQPPLFTVSMPFVQTETAPITPTITTYPPKIVGNSGGEPYVLASPKPLYPIYWGME